MTFYMANGPFKRIGTSRRAEWPSLPPIEPPVCSPSCKSGLQYFLSQLSSRIEKKGDVNYVSSHADVKLTLKPGVDKGRRGEISLYNAVPTVVRVRP
jgi:hypothetical protein